MFVSSIGCAAAAVQHRTPVMAASRVLAAILAVFAALAPDSAVGAHAFTALLWRLCSQMLAPQQSLYWPLMRLCWQMPAPPQFLNMLELMMRRRGGSRGSHADLGLNWF